MKDALGTVLTAYVQTDALGYEGYWMPPSPTSKFISPFIDTVDPSGSGTFTYTTSFVLGAEIDLAHTTLTLNYASDNAMTVITCNGSPLVDIAVGGYSAFETRAITTLVRGTNTLSLSVSNSGGPTGVRVELALQH